jgi:hypothetical protein
MNISNPKTYQLNLVPQHINFSTEGGLDTSIINGKSVQRTANLLLLKDYAGNLKVVNKVNDGDAFDDVVSSNVKSWIVIDGGMGYRTTWLYTVTSVKVAFEEVGLAENNKVVFSNMADLYNFYEKAFLKTAEEQPVGNVGYSLGAGTILRDLGTTIDLHLDSGLKVITWRMVEQITSQANISIGGNSPDGTIGFVCIYADWDNDGVQDPGISVVPENLGYGYGDLMLVRPLELT